MPLDAPSISVEDAVLVEKCRQGDSSAMERLILKYQNRLYNVILRICVNQEDAAELTQETFVKIIENLDRFEGKSGFYTWAFRIAVNVTLNHRRRCSRLGFQSIDTEDGDPNHQATQALKDILMDEKAPDPVSVTQNRELCEIVNNSLLKLDDNHRAVIVLRDIEGMSYEQIARVLDLELGTVRSRISRARAHLKEILEAIIE